MTQDLRLELESTPTNVAPLTHYNTDLGWTNWDTTATWTPNLDTYHDFESMTVTRGDSTSAAYLAKAYSPGESYLNTRQSGYGSWVTYGSINECVLSGYSKDECTHRQRGDYYSYSAAVAENDTNTTFYNTSGNVAPNSICPAGWRLIAGATGYNNLESEHSDLMVLITKTGILDTRYNWSVRTSSVTTSWTAHWIGWVTEPIYETPLYMIPNGAVMEGVNSNNQWTYSQQYAPGSQTDYLESRTMGYSIVPGTMSFALGYRSSWMMGVRCVAR
jgi:hypothetical protein